MPLYQNIQRYLQPRHTEDDSFGSGVDLDAPVGPRGDNRTPDVIKVEKSLGAVGYMDPVRASRPTGRFDAELDSALRSYQGGAKLRQDGLVNPRGPTLKAMSRRKAANTIPHRRVSEEAVGSTNRLVSAMGKTRDKTEVSKLLADTALNYGATGQAEVAHLMRQAAQDSPDGAADLQDALSRNLPPKLHRALYARAMSSEDGDDSDYGDNETPPPEEEAPKPGPGEDKPKPGEEKPGEPKKPETDEEDEEYPEEEPEPESEPEPEPEPDCTQEDFNVVEAWKKLHDEEKKYPSLEYDIRNKKEKIKVDEADIAFGENVLNVTKAGGLLSAIPHPLGRFAGFVFNVGEKITEAKIRSIKKELNQKLITLKKWEKEWESHKKELVRRQNALSAAQWRLSQCLAGKPDSEESREGHGKAIS
jgi:hypothetical protein